MNRHLPQRSPSQILLFGFATLSALLLSACKPADKRLNAQELAQAEEAFQSCIICHSVQEMQRGPIINGLPRWYARAQLDKFHSGVRGRNESNRSEFLMGSTRDQFPDEATRELLARYIAELPPKPYHRVVKGDATRGAALYGTCIPCHGPQGKGQESFQAPPLNIQEDWYLMDQLRKFASGARGSHPMDPQGQAMRLSLANLQAQDLKDIVVHIQSFSQPAEPDPRPYQSRP